jgi:hypothetical protein
MKETAVQNDVVKSFSNHERSILFFLRSCPIVNQLSCEQINLLWDTFFGHGLYLSSEARTSARDFDEKNISRSTDNTNGPRMLSNA